MMQGRNAMPPSSRVLLCAFFGKLTEKNSYANLENSFICSQRDEKRVSLRSGYFEGIVHDMLEKGINIFIDPMVVERNNRANAVIVKYVASGISLKRGQWGTCLLVRMTAAWSWSHYITMCPSTHPIPLTIRSHSSLPRVYFYEGPILNPRDKEICDKAVLGKVNFQVFLLYDDVHSPTGLVAQPYRCPKSGSSQSFEVTIAAAEHLTWMKKGLDYICMIADHNELNAIGIRYIYINRDHSSRRSMDIQNDGCLVRKTWCIIHCLSRSTCVTPKVLPYPRQLNRHFHSC